MDLSLEFLGKKRIRNVDDNDHQISLGFSHLPKLVLP